MRSRAGVCTQSSTSGAAFHAALDQGGSFGKEASPKRSKKSGARAKTRNASRKKKSGRRKYTRGRLKTKAAMALLGVTGVIALAFGSLFLARSWRSQRLNRESEATKSQQYVAAVGQNTAAGVGSAAGAGASLDDSAVVTAQSALSNTCSDVFVVLDQSTDASASPYALAEDLQLAGGKLIVPGHPVEDTLLTDNAYMHFQACIPDEEQHHHYHNIRVHVEALEGDPDLYISATVERPTAVDSTWLSKHIGSDFVNLPSNHADFPKGARTLYVGINARSVPTKFRLSVTIEDRKNKYQGLRYRKDDASFQRTVEHETWKSANE